MKKCGTILLIALLGAALTLSAEAGFVDRLSIDFFNFGGNESATSLGIPGIVIFQKTLFVPDECDFDPHCVPGGDQVMNVKITATGDVHDGRALLLVCRIGAIPCNPGTPFSGTAPGWVNVLKLPAATSGATNCNDGGGGAGDCHDNNIHYEWCIPSSRFRINDFNTVTIRMAALPAGGFVFLEAAQVEIDTSTIEAQTPGGSINPCGRVDPPTPAVPGQRRP